MSVVNHSNKVIFSHVPKTGGSSMQQAPFLQSNGHAPLSKLFELCRQKGQDPESYFSFAFVRHPVDRLYSTYRAYRQHSQPNPCPPLGQSFTDFVGLLDDDPDRIHQFPHLRPLEYWIDVPAVSFIGRFENIEHDWQKVCAAVGEDWPLPKVNVTNRDGEEISSDTRFMIQQLYLWDMLRFDYSFDR